MCYIISFDSKRTHQYMMQLEIDTRQLLGATEPEPATEEKLAQDEILPGPSATILEAEKKVPS